jgi:hypothetical protein
MSSGGSPPSARLSTSEAPSGSASNPRLRSYANTGSNSGRRAGGGDPGRRNRRLCCNGCGWFWFFLIETFTIHSDSKRIGQPDLAGGEGLAFLATSCKLTFEASATP